MSEVTDDRAGRREDIRRSVDEMTRPMGLGLVMFAEDQYLLTDAVRAYIGGADAGTVFCCHAACERDLAGLVLHSGTAPRGSDKWGLGSLIVYLRQHQMLPADLLDRLAQLNEHRKTLYHYGHADSSAALQRRTSEFLDRVGSEQIRADFEKQHGEAGSNKNVYRFAMDAVLKDSALNAIVVMFELRSQLAADL